jgi:hypothetical protein
VLWYGSNEGELLLIGLRPKEAILSEGGYGERCSFGDGFYGDGGIEDDLMMLVDKRHLNGGVELNACLWRCAL